jgi:hypothetical protein
MRVLMLLLLAMSSMVVNAVESNHRMVIAHPIIIPQGGNIEEVLSLAKQWRKKVINTIPHVLKSELLLEKKSKKEYELLMVYYFKDVQGERDSIAMMGPAIQKAWPDKKAQQAFFTKLQSYVVEAKKTTRFYSVVN